MSPKCQGADVILLWLNCTKNYEDKRKCEEWAPPPPVVLLICLIKFLCLINYQDWERRSPRVRNDIYLEGTWFAFFILSLVNNSSYLQTFVFGLMLLHS